MAEQTKLEVSLRIEAPAALIFEILANPQRHVDFDGSGMLRGAVLDRPVSEVGDTFIMIPRDDHADVALVVADTGDTGRGQGVMKSPEGAQDPTLFADGPCAEALPCPSREHGMSA